MIKRYAIAFGSLIIVVLGIVVWYRIWISSTYNFELNLISTFSEDRHLFSDDGWDIFTNQDELNELKISGLTMKNDYDEHYLVISKYILQSLSTLKHYPCKCFPSGEVKFDKEHSKQGTYYVYQTDTKLIAQVED